MTDTVWWAWLWGQIENWAFLGVVVALAIEFAALKLGSPYKEALDKAREERISAANERAAKAELELAKFKAPRVLKPEQLAAITAAMRAFPGTQFDVAVGPFGDPEPEVFGRSISSALIAAGWSQTDWDTLDVQMRLTRPGGAAIGFAAVTNVIVDIHPSQTGRLWSAAQALAASLRAQGIDADAEQGSGGRNTNETAIHVMIGRKM